MTPPLKTCVGCPTNHCADCPLGKVGGIYKGPCVDCGSSRPTELGRCVECRNEIAFSTVAPDQIRTHIASRHLDDAFPSFTDADPEMGDAPQHEQLAWESERWSEP